MQKNGTNRLPVRNIERGETVKQRALSITFFISLSISAALLFFLAESMAVLWPR